MPRNLISQEMLQPQRRSKRHNRLPSSQLRKAERRPVAVTLSTERLHIDQALRRRWVFASSDEDLVVTHVLYFMCILKLFVVQAHHPIQLEQQLRRGLFGTFLGQKSSAPGVEAHEAQGIQGLLAIIVAEPLECVDRRGHQCSVVDDSKSDARGAPHSLTNSCHISGLSKNSMADWWTKHITLTFSPLLYLSGLTESILSLKNLFPSRLV